jgi:hypothetical protein
MNEAWTEETAIYALTMIFLEEPPKKEESKELEVIQDEQVLEGEVEEIAPPPFYRRPIPRRWAILLCSCLLIISTVASTVLIVLFTSTATIEVALLKRPVSFQQDFTIPVAQQFRDVTKVLSQTAKATGIGHQDATYAIGNVTFYNSLPASQAIPAGTLLIGVDGMHIVTDTIAYVPPGNFSTNGQVTVPAHVTTTGSQGNIAVGDFSGACCRDYVFARTGQFTGGQDERTFTIVSQSDVNTLLTRSTGELDQQINDTMTPRYQEVITPPQCSQSIVSTPNVGQEASEVTVTLAKTCSAASYSYKRLEDEANKYYKRLVEKKFGSSYIPVGSPQVHILTTSVKEEVVKITAVVNGMVVYHFRKADMDKLKRLVAGKSKEQVGQIMLKWHDIRLTGIQLQFSQNNLPTDPGRIRVNVKP